MKSFVQEALIDAYNGTFGIHVPKQYEIHGND